MDFLLKLCGIKSVEAGRVTETALVFRGVNPVWVLLAAIVLVAGVWWMYRRAAADLNTPRRIALTTLRGLFLVLILGLLLRPELTITYEDLVRRSVLFLIDDTGSMSKIKDQRFSDEDRKRVAIVRGDIDPAKGLDQQLQGNGELANIPRIDVVKAGLKNRQINLVPRLAKNYDVSAFSFDRQISELSDAAYKQKPRAAHGLLQRMPWLLPSGLLLVGLALLMAGAIGRSAWAKYLALTVMIAALLWGVTATMRARKAIDQPVLATETADTLPLINLAWVDALSAEEKPTALGDAIRDAIAKKGAQRLSAIVLVTDGASNSGLHPLDAAKIAGGRKIPIFAWGVGSSGIRDIELDRNLFAPRVAFAKDKLAVSARVRSVGMAGRQATLTVKLGEEKTEQTVYFGPDGEQLVTVELTPKKVGDHEVQASLAPLDDEANKANNLARQPIQVKDGKVKVLYVEQSPRWEFRYIQEILRRQGTKDDRRVDLKCVLFEADPRVAEGEGTIYLKEFPKDGKELFGYDVLILGDVDPRKFTTQQLDAINEFIGERGGGLVMLAGKKFNPHGYRGTPLEKLLPVELLPADTGLNATNGADKPIKLEMTPVGRESRLLRFTDDEAKALKTWEELAPIYWTARVGRAKPAAQVLVVDPDQAKGTQYGKMPVIATQQYGRGPVLYVGTDNLWRWRRNEGERYHWTLWAQLTQRAARPHQLGGAKQIQLSSDRDVYPTNTMVTVYARLYPNGYEPLTTPTAKGFYREAGSDKSHEVTLQAMPGHAGLYRGQFMPPSAGKFAFTVDLDQNVPLEVVVEEIDVELRETAMNRSMLEKVAASSGGTFLREEDLYTLPEKLAAKAEREKRIEPAELWCSPVYFLLLMAAVTGEWVLRKMSQLK